MYVKYFAEINEPVELVAYISEHKLEKKQLEIERAGILSILTEGRVHSLTGMGIDSLDYCLSKKVKFTLFDEHFIFFAVDCLVFLKVSGRVFEFH